MLRSLVISKQIVISGLFRWLSECNLIQFITIFLITTQTINAQYFNERYPVTDGWGGGALMP